MTYVSLSPPRARARTHTHTKVDRHALRIARFPHRQDRPARVEAAMPNFSGIKPPEASPAPQGPHPLCAHHHRTRPLFFFSQLALLWQVQKKRNRVIGDNKKKMMPR
ncbi:hypothetical protein DM02DRAFT_7245 [Periconia macrospinosa]|uniref:Uncharacterized protein n=1 Tax=Periconia macrospinosa TaxID=97972 RepID=A0A2V1EDB6_9PLEO|nr:hypothetical protein DM02DRAFT_7245 [Periconia macrospinosa]